MLKNAGKRAKKAGGQQVNAATKTRGRKLNAVERAIVANLAQIPGFQELDDVIFNEYNPPQGAWEYYGGGAARDIYASFFTTVGFATELVEAYSWLHVGNRKDPDKYLGFWTEWLYETARQVTKSKYIVPGIKKGVKMIEDGWTKIGEYGVYGYRKSLGGHGKYGKELGRRLANMLYDPAAVSKGVALDRKSTNWLKEASGTYRYMGRKGCSLDTLSYMDKVEKINEELSSLCSQFNNSMGHWQMILPIN